LINRKGLREVAGHKHQDKTKKESSGKIVEPNQQIPEDSFL
jgi:hypothetical protein